MRLSVVICVYNTDREYFEKCLKSITDSTLDKSSYEILVIDDGSEKDYSDILERYGARCIKTENRGMLAARSLGIAEAKGEYVVFSDSDDTVSFNYHRPMLERAEQTCADIVIGDWAFHTDKSRFFCRKDSTIAGEIDCSGDEVLPLFVSRGGREHSYFVLWNKLFRRELLSKAQEYVLPISEKMGKFNSSEDALRCFLAYKLARRVVNVHSGFYFYRIHSSQSVNATSEASLRRQIECMGASFEAMLSHIGNHPRAEEINAGIEKWMELMSRTHYSYARAGGYTSLYSLISSTYRVKTLRRSKFSDSRVYMNNRVLPLNFTDIDRALFELWQEGGAISLIGADGYTRASVDYMIKQGAKISLDKNGEKLPKGKYSLKDLIIKHPIVYAAGLLLFPKGSKIRSFLKRRL